MAKLSAFRVDSGAQQSGEWIKPGDEYDDLTLKVRGFTDTYYDAQAQAMRRAARTYDGDVTKIPSGRQRDIRVQCLIEHIFLDVRNLADDAGQPVTAAQFRSLMQNPDHGDLTVAVMRAAAKVGRGQAADIEEAAGN